MSKKKHTKLDQTSNQAIIKSFADFSLEGHVKSALAMKKNDSLVNRLLAYTRCSTCHENKTVYMKELQLLILQLRSFFNFFQKYLSRSEAQTPNQTGGCAQVL